MLSLLLVGLLLGLLAAPAAAQALDAATTLTATNTSSAATAAASGVPPIAASPQLQWILTATLLFALAALAIVFAYIYSIQRKFYETTASLGRAGRTVQITSVAAFAMSKGGPPSAQETLQSRLQIRGPAAVSVGQESAEFSVTLQKNDGSESAADNARWSVEPANTAVVNPQQGAKVKVIATTVGAFKLMANSDDAVAAELSVAALAPQPAPVQLPFIGQAYGSIAIAILLIAAVIVLGLAGILSSEGAATILGALLGYIFGVTRQGSANPPANNQATE
jgi:hypothetical protein